MLNFASNTTFLAELTFDGTFRANADKISDSDMITFRVGQWSKGHFNQLRCGMVTARVRRQIYSGIFVTEAPREVFLLNSNGLLVRRDGIATSGFGGTIISRFA